MPILIPSISILIVVGLWFLSIVLLTDTIGFICGGYDDYYGSKSVVKNMINMISDIISPIK